MGKKLSYEEGAALGLPTPKKKLSYEEGSALGLPSPVSSASSEQPGILNRAANAAVDYLQRRSELESKLIGAPEELTEGELAELGSPGVGLAGPLPLALSATGNKAAQAIGEHLFRGVNPFVKQEPARNEYALQQAIGKTPADVLSFASEEVPKNVAMVAGGAAASAKAVAHGLKAAIPRILKMGAVNVALASGAEAVKAPRGQRGGVAIETATDPATVALSVALAGAGELIGSLAARRRAAVEKQMAAVLGPEGGAFDSTAPFASPNVGPLTLSERGTVPDYRGGAVISSGVLPIEGRILSERPPLRDTKTSPGDFPAGAGEMTFTGPTTPAERELAMFEAGKTRTMLRGVGEDTNAKVKAIELLAAERGSPVVQDPEFSRREGNYFSPDRRAELLSLEKLQNARRGPSEPTYREKSALSGPDTVPLHVQGRPEFQAAVDALDRTVTRYIHPNELELGSRERALELNPDATFIRARNALPGVGGGAGTPPSLPPEVLAARRALNAQLHVVAAPLAGPPVSAPLTPANVTQSAASHAAEVLRLSAKDLGGKLGRMFSQPEFRAQEDVAYAIRAHKAAKASSEVAMRTYEDLRAAIPPGEFARVQRIIVGQRDLSLLANTTNQLPAEFRRLVQHFEAQKQNQVFELARNGYYSPSEAKVMLANIRAGNAWWHRTYQAFAAKKGFKPSGQAVTEAADFIAKVKGISPDEAYGEVRALLFRVLNEGAPVRTSAQLDSVFRDAGLMKGRTLPAPLHNLLGVINDPSFIIADSMGELARQFHLMHVTKGIVTPQLEGIVWSRTRHPDFAPNPLWDPTKDLAGNKRIFGELAGKYVKPQLYESMIDFTDASAARAWGQLWDVPRAFFIGGKILLSPITWTRNLISNAYYLSLAGVPPWKWRGLAKLAAQSMLDAGSFAHLTPFKGLNKKLVGKMEFGRATSGEFARMAREDWALAEGRGTDWGGNEARRIIEEMIRGTPGGFPGVYKQLWSKLQNVKGQLGRGYELADQLPRLMAYIHHLGEGAKMDMPEMAARARATQLVHKWFATGADAAPVFRTIARSGGSPFAGWFADNMRVHKNIAADAARGEFGPLMRASLYHAALWGGAQALWQLSGFTDADISAGEKALKGSWRDTHAFHAWAPFKGKDANGNETMYAVSYDGIAPYASFLKYPEGHPVKGVAASVVKGMMSGGPLAMPVDYLLEKAGVAPAEYEPPTPLSQEGAFALYDTMSRWGKPTALQQFQNSVRKAQLAPGVSPLRPTEEAMGPIEAFVTQFNPLSFEKVSVHTREGARKQTQGEIGELRDARKAAKKLPPEEAALERALANERMQAVRRKERNR